MTLKMDWRYFETAGLRLTPYSASAEEQAFSAPAFDTPRELQRWIKSAYPSTIDEFQELTVASNATENPSHVWTVRQKDEAERIVGCICLRNNHNGAATLVYHFSAEHGDQTLTAEAINAVIEFGFDVLELGQISSSVFHDNDPSQKLMVRAGFQHPNHDEMPLTATAPAPAGTAANLGSMLIMSAADFRHHRMREGCHSFTTILHRSLPIITVAAAALVNPSGEILVAQRPAGKSMAGLWEFPGGKLEPGETPEAALIRELSEELGIETDNSCLSPVAFASHSYPKFHLMMPVFAIRQWRGEITGREGQAVQWVAPRQLWDLPMPPADEPIIPLLIDLL